MKQSLLLLLLISLAFAGKLRVVTSIPDIADMVNEIGGDKVTVKSLATGREDLHAVPARPSFLPLLNRADLLFTLGLSAEHAWLPAIAREARNPSIVQGQPGWIELNKGVTVLEIPETLDRCEGEQHANGNPHFNIGPQAGVSMAENICSVLIENDPTNEEYYQNRYERYRSEIETAIALLQEKGTKLRGKKIVTYHKDVAYLCGFYGMEQFGAIEVKPGVPPTASHLRSLEESATNSDIGIIIHNQSQSERIPNRLGVSLSVPVVEIANAVGAKSEITTWIELQNYNLDRLLEAMDE